MSLLAQALVLQGADILALGYKLRGLCHKAASAGNKRFMEWSLQTLELNPSSRDKSSRTPLLLAVEGGWVRSVHVLLKHVLEAREGDDSVGYARVVEAMEYANMQGDKIRKEDYHSNGFARSRQEVFQKLSPVRKMDIINLRMAFYTEAPTWAIDCDFPDGFAFLLAKISKAALSFHSNIDRDTIYYCK